MGAFSQRFRAGLITFDLPDADLRSGQKKKVAVGPPAIFVPAFIDPVRSHAV